MSVGGSLHKSGELFVPDSIQPETRPGLQLPRLDLATLDELRANGWYNVGVMVAVVNPDGDVLMQNHARREKNSQGVLGPLGETTKSMGSAIEQPAETLLRGFREETGIMSPQELGLTMHPYGGWRINQWPNSDRHRGRFSCAIAFPVFLSADGYEYLQEQFVPNEEVYEIQFRSPDEILDMDPAKLRRGVQPWLSQLVEAELLDIDPVAPLVPVGQSQSIPESLASQDITLHE